MINRDKFYKVEEVAQLGQEGLFPFKSVTSIYDLINHGKLRAFRESAAGEKVTVRIKGEDILMFLDSSSSVEIQNVKGRRGKKEKNKGT